MMNRAVAVLILSAVVLGSVLWTTGQPRVIADNDSVKIVTRGRSVDIYDVSGDHTYHFKCVHVRRSEAPVKRYTAIETDTVRIDIVPCGGLEISVDGKCYKITPKEGRFVQWLKRCQMKNS